ncbi:hypothetical protein IHE45_13G058300 [Dioscorea alata]|uniref:Uncharacterized protein n=1 Tax=Dioscorea alata TaxID=55571 RepID=A0ACB7UYM4_DIOAL|nr:hypothetical protein IHE45_13G058300 [Dioscorea alata]
MSSPSPLPSSPDYHSPVPANSVVVTVTIPSRLMSSPSLLSWLMSSPSSPDYHRPVPAPLLQSWFRSWLPLRQRPQNQEHRGD